jgi:hypothetical protein
MSETYITEERVKQLLKEGIEKALKVFEGKLNTQITLDHNSVLSNVAEQTDKFDKMGVQLNELNSMVNTDKIYVNRIDELLQFMRKTTDQINSHELRIANVTKSLQTSCYKYDKIFLDNLQIPGTIGDYCRFKNMKEYIDVKIINYSITSPKFRLLTPLRKNKLPISISIRLNSMTYLRLLILKSNRVKKAQGTTRTKC